MQSRTEVIFHTSTMKKDYSKLDDLVSDIESFANKHGKEGWRLAAMIEKEYYIIFTFYKEYIITKG